MVRWSAVALGCVAALGMEAVFRGAAARLDLQQSLTSYAVEALALVLGGFVAGHLAPSAWRALNGALAASTYILLGATVTAVQEASLAGTVALGPIDLPDLVSRDLVALVSASVGGWLAGFPRTTGSRP